MMLTIEKLKKLINISADDDELDELLAAIIEASSTIVENYTDRAILSSYIEESFTGNGRAFYVTNEYPIIELLSVKEDGKEINDVEVRSDTGGILFRGSGFYTGSKYEVKYKAGYKSVPRDIEYAQQLIAMQMYGHLDKVKQGVTSIITPDGTINYDLGLIPKAAATILDRYKRKLY